MFKATIPSDKTWQKIKKAFILSLLVFSRGSEATSNQRIMPTAIANEDAIKEFDHLPESVMRCFVQSADLSEYYKRLEVNSDYQTLIDDFIRDCVDEESHSTDSLSIAVQALSKAASYYLKATQKFFTLQPAKEELEAAEFYQTQIRLFLESNQKIKEQAEVIRLNNEKIWDDFFEGQIAEYTINKDSKSIREALEVCYLASLSALVNNFNQAFNIHINVIKNGLPITKERYDKLAEALEFLYEFLNNISSELVYPEDKNLHLIRARYVLFTIQRRDIYAVNNRDDKLHRVCLDILKQRNDFTDTTPEQKEIDYVINFCIDHLNSFRLEAQELEIFTSAHELITSQMGQYNDEAYPQLKEAYEKTDELYLPFDSLTLEDVKLLSIEMEKLKNEELANHYFTRAVGRVTFGISKYSVYGEDDIYQRGLRDLEIAIKLSEKSSVHEINRDRVITGFLNHLYVNNDTLKLKYYIEISSDHKKQAINLFNENYRKYIAGPTDKQAFEAACFYGRTLLKIKNTTADNEKILLLAQFLKIKQLAKNYDEEFEKYKSRFIAMVERNKAVYAASDSSGIVKEVYNECNTSGILWAHWLRIFAIPAGAIATYNYLLKQSKSAAEKQECDKIRNIILNPIAEKFGLDVNQFDIKLLQEKKFSSSITMPGDFKYSLTCHTSEFTDSDLKGYIGKTINIELTIDDIKQFIEETKLFTDVEIKVGSDTKILTFQGSSNKTYPKIEGEFKKFLGSKIKQTNAYKYAIKTKAEADEFLKELKGAKQTLSDLENYLKKIKKEIIDGLKTIKISEQNKKMKKEFRRIKQNLQNVFSIIRTKIKAIEGKEFKERELINTLQAAKKEFFKVKNSAKLQELLEESSLGQTSSENLAQCYDVLVKSKDKFVGKYTRKHQEDSKTTVNLPQQKSHMPFNPGKEEVDEEDLFEEKEDKKQKRASSKKKRILNVEEKTERKQDNREYLRNLSFKMQAIINELTFDTTKENEVCHYALVYKFIQLADVVHKYAKKKELPDAQKIQEFSRKLRTFFNISEQCHLLETLQENLINDIVAPDSIFNPITVVNKLAYFKFSEEKCFISNKDNSENKFYELIECIKGETYKLKSLLENEDKSETANYAVLYCAYRIGLIAEELLEMWKVVKQSERQNNLLTNFFNTGPNINILTWFSDSSKTMFQLVNINFYHNFTPILDKCNAMLELVEKASIKNTDNTSSSLTTYSGTLFAAQAPHAVLSSSVVIPCESEGSSETSTEFPTP